MPVDQTVVIKPSRITKVDVFEFWDPLVTPGRFCRLRRAGMDISEPYSSTAESFSVFWLRKTRFLAPAGWDWPNSAQPPNCAKAGFESKIVQKYGFSKVK